MESIRVACATDDQVTFVAGHFGEAKYFVLYRLGRTGWEVEEVLENRAREGAGHHHEHGHGHGHGEGRKARAILEHFREKKVDVFASRRFGPNIVVISQYVLPVVVRGRETLEEGLEALRSHYDVLVERLREPAGERKHLVIT